MQWEDFICVGCKEEIFSYLKANKKYIAFKHTFAIM
jgi:hypothetical protein